MNQSFINGIKQDRYFARFDTANTRAPSLYYRIFIRSDRWRYGDLYGLCYLPQFKLKIKPFKNYTNNDGKLPSRRILYILGDSFLADKVLTKAFDGFDNVIFLDRRFPIDPVRLDSSKQNYLLMEFAERNLNGLDFNPVTASNNNTFQSSGFFGRLGKIIFNKDLSRNLELLWFDDKLFTPFKELKAAINYRLFNRVSKDVAVSTDKKRLFLNATVDTDDIHSSFRIKKNSDIDSVVLKLNKLHDYYISFGFKNVFLSIIPNPVSLYDYNRMPYNHLLEKVESKTQLPYVPIYQIYKSNKYNLYDKSDTHWNPLGFDIWIQETNKLFQASISTQ